MPSVEWERWGMICLILFTLTSLTPIICTSGKVVGPREGRDMRKWVENQTSWLSLLDWQIWLDMRVQPCDVYPGAQSWPVCLISYCCIISMDWGFVCPAGEHETGMPWESASRLHKPTTYKQYETATSSQRPQRPQQQGCCTFRRYD